MKDVERSLRKNIGKKIKLARTKEKYTQEELAEKLSLSPRYISQLERGIAFGSATTITSICNALNISSNFLFEDLITSNTPTLTQLVEQSFLEDYLKLDDHHKSIIKLLTKQLAQIQKDDSFSKNV